MKKGTYHFAIALLLGMVLFLSWNSEALCARDLPDEIIHENSGEEKAVENGILRKIAVRESHSGIGEPDGTVSEEHSLVKTERKESTCAEEGNIEYWTCKDCGKFFADEAGTQEIADKAALILPKLSDHVWAHGAVTKAASCEEGGVLTYTCQVCKAVKTEQIAPTGHQYQDRLTRATTKKQGKIASLCTVCGKVSRQTAIPRIKKITLSVTSYTFNGKMRAPRVKVVDAKGRKISAKYYRVKNGKAKNVGTHTVKISFTGNYEGSVTRKFKINPKKVSGIQVSAEKKGFTVTFKKQSRQCSGYQLQYGKNPDFSGAVKVSLQQGTSQARVGDLESSATYYVRMRAFKKVKEHGKVKTYYSAWSKRETVQTMDVKLICIDAGHQQRGDSALEPIGPGAAISKPKVASGTSGAATGRPEYQLTLEVALKLQQELTQRGYDVLMIRTTHDVNISNSARAAIANDAHADAFIRIHANSSTNASVNGVITICQTPGNAYCGAYYSQCRKLSEQILSHFTAACGCRNGGIWETDTMSGINWCSVPVTILEMGYMSNPSEDRLMSDAAYQAKMVQGIANGVDAYFAP